MSLSTYAFCRGDRNAIGRSQIPMARRRCTKTGPYEVSRSRMRYRGAWSHGKASVIWREILWLLKTPQRAEHLEILASRHAIVGMITYLSACACSKLREIEKA